jgi:spore coat polysaccharide biosynthesis predicted glycosyltransferase SpsG
MGHLFRALALAEALEARGASVHLYVNDDEGARRTLRGRGRTWKAVALTSGGWEAERIREDRIRVWVNDRFETTADHARRVLQAGARLVTFNDCGPGAALADLHIAPVPLAEGLRPTGRRVLTGLSYLVLDPQVKVFRRVRSRLRSLVVSMGGRDTYGLTVRVAQELRARRRQATIIVGPGFAHEKALAETLGEELIVKRSILSLAEEFSRHDLAVTAGGITPFEANAAGLPCLTVAAEPWEEQAAAMLAALGGCRYLGPRTRIDFSSLGEDLPITRMSEAALRTVPADGAERVAAELLAL